MKIDKNMKDQINKIFEKTEDKTDAVIEAMELVNENRYKELISQITEEAANVQANADYMKQLGLHQPTKSEREFYEIIKSGNIKQAISADQITVIPTEIIDRTMDGLKKESTVLELVDFAPANVKRWISASYTGSYVWGELFSALDKTKDIQATFKSIDLELGKLWALIIIPKAVRDLALPFVDKYFTAVLAEVMRDGLEYGYINGAGIASYQPIGILNTIDDPATAKTAVEITDLTPVGLADACVTLTTVNGVVGARAIDELHIVCNAADYFQYVRPAMLVQNAMGAWVDGTGMNIKVHPTTNIESGKAALTIPHAYVMGSSGVALNEYKETLALDDADLVIGKVYANGRPADDNAAVVFDPTKLTPLYFNVKTITGA